jgi:phospholipase A1
MKNAAVFILLTLQLCLSGAADATDDKSLQPCLEMQNKGESDQALTCYKQAAQAQQAPGGSQQPAKSIMAIRDKKLADEWAPSASPLNVYKQNYFLFYSHLSQPNNAPTSPNPQNQVPFSYSLENREMKFQISVKSHLVGEDKHTLWFGYTQLSFWQAYDTAHSNPFRETNYEPEIIYSYRPEHLMLGSTTVSFLNGGLVHQSNGQSLPRSRSWNRIYAQAGLENDIGNNQRLALLVRYWKRLDGGGANDDNPDIVNYLGHGDLEARYYYGPGMLSAIARSRSIQLDLAVSLWPVGIKNSNLHFQYFDGYGESLIDYNQKHTTLGVGISMPFE